MILLASRNRYRTRRRYCRRRRTGLFGIDWGSTIALSASALLVPYDEFPDMPTDLRGVHYCKLLPPSQMLNWMRYRAFFDNPLGAGLTRDTDAVLVAEEVADCRLQGISPRGSCIFFFSVSKQHFCEEYSGPQWDLASAEERCADREQAVFSSSLCAERLSETEHLDNDGEYKGECVINCGQPDEYRWKVYSQPENMQLEAACGASWFAAP